MTCQFRRTLSFLLCLCLFFPLFSAITAQAAEDADSTAQAKDISGVDILADHNGFESTEYLFDGNPLEGDPTPGNASLTLEYTGGIGSLYFIFGTEYDAYTVTNNDSGESYTCGESRFLHEFIDLEAAFGAAPTSVTIDFANGSADIYELCVYTSGKVPDSVQKWTDPVDDKTDLILFSTHGDDEQLFFAGILPYYAKELGYQVQVVYLTDHRNLTQKRIHEMLNGLWAVGVDTYPVFGPYNDFFVDNKESAYMSYSVLGWPKEQMVGYVVEQLRRFNPLVVIGHDFDGEYGHGQHMVYAELLAEALEISNDPTAYPELAEQYGLWDVPKAYFHLYEENPIVMDWDQPLESFDGMTAYEVTKHLGYPCHVTQYYDFAWYLTGYDTAAEVARYSPCEYGLYRTTVGHDVKKNDFFENLITYTELDRLAEEERLAEEQRQEEERLAAEEQDRLEKEEAAREEAERQEKIEEQLQEDAALRRNVIICIVAVCVLILALMLLTFSIEHRRSQD